MPALCAPVTSISWTSTLGVDQAQADGERRRRVRRDAEAVETAAPRAARASTAGAAGVPGGVAVGTITAPRGTRLTSRDPRRQHEALRGSAGGDLDRLARHGARQGLADGREAAVAGARRAAARARRRRPQGRPPRTANQPARPSASRVTRAAVQRAGPGPERADAGGAPPRAGGLPRRRGSRPVPAAPAAAARRRRSARPRPAPPRCCPCRRLGVGASISRSTAACGSPARALDHLADVARGDQVGQAVAAQQQRAVGLEGHLVDVDEVLVVRLVRAPSRRRGRSRCAAGGASPRPRTARRRPRASRPASGRGSPCGSRRGAAGRAGCRRRGRR